jgi:hypothetical protein
MRDIYQVLYRKERQLQQVRREVEVLRIVIPLLEEESAAPAMAARAAGVIPFERAPRSSLSRAPSPLAD